MIKVVKSFSTYKILGLDIASIPSTLTSHCGQYIPTYSNGFQFILNILVNNRGVIWEQFIPFIVIFIVIE